jgi:hypothetical protein
MINDTDVPPRRAAFWLALLPLAPFIVAIVAYVPLVGESITPWLEREERWSFVTSDARDRPHVLPTSHEDPLTRPADQTRPVTTPGGPAAAPGTTTKEPDMNDTTRRSLESLAKLPARAAGALR